MNATNIDWIIVAAFLVFLSIAGYGCKYFIKSTADWTVAGRNMRKFLGLSTGTAEGLGLISIVALSEIGFKSGFSYIGISIVVLVTVPVIYGFTGFVINRYREAKVVTVPEYAQFRYSKGVRVLTGVVLAFSGIMNLAIFPIMASQFLTHFINVPSSINFAGIAMPFVPVLMAVLVGLALLFTYCGGMVSVILTDFIQSIIIAAMCFAITFLAIKDAGFSGMHHAVNTNLGEGGYNPFTSETFGVVFIIVVIIQQIIGFPSFAPTMQKIASTDNTKTARQMTLLAWIFGQGRALMIVLWGVAAFAVLGNTAPDGMEQSLYTKVAGAIYLGELVPPVLFGIVLAGMLAAFISTVDSYLLTWSTVIVNDAICPLITRPISQRNQMRLLKVVVSLIALFIYIFGVLYQPAETLLVYIMMTGVMMLGAGIILIGGLYWRKGNTAGAYSAVISCCVIPSLDLLLRRTSVKNYLPKPQYSAFVAIVVAIFLYVIVSLLFSRNRITELKTKKE